MLESFPNTISKSRRTTDVTHIQPIKNNKIQNPLTFIIYVRTFPLGVISKTRRHLLLYASYTRSVRGLPGGAEASYGMDIDVSISSTLRSSLYATVVTSPVQEK